MKKTKILAFILAAMLIALPLMSCNTGGDDENTDTNEVEETGEDVTLTVSMKVKNHDGDVEYDIPSYTYTGKAPTIIDLIDDYFYMEMDPLSVVTDEVNGIRTIVSIGDIEAGEVIDESSTTEDGESLYTTMWWYTLNGREGSLLLDNYTVKNGDSIEFFLKTISSADTKK